MICDSITANLHLRRSLKYITYLALITMGIRTHMQRKFLPGQIHLTQPNHLPLRRACLPGIHSKVMHPICQGTIETAL